MSAASVAAVALAWAEALAGGDVDQRIVSREADLPSRGMQNTMTSTLLKKLEENRVKAAEAATAAVKAYNEATGLLVKEAVCATADKLRKDIDGGAVHTECVSCAMPKRHSYKRICTSVGVKFEVENPDLTVRWAEDGAWGYFRAVVSVRGV
jgi:hypothetical protein